ncbi:reverse transcriptase domain-containing protein [Bradyrhizobium barranii]|uniref:reverse transcriptase domain-containing protein n=1 Tax=Bradyrhizobium barranii TaxID=2992140 RepID=UPI003CCAA2EF
MDRGCGPERLLRVRGSRETHGSPRQANRRQRRVETHSTDAEGWLRGKGSAVRDSTGTPQGGVISPLLSNILLTPFDKEMRQRGYRLTRWADDWVVTCRTRAEAEHALARAGRILETLGVTLNREKTRIVHIAHGFEFLGFKIQRGKLDTS